MSHALLIGNGKTESSALLKKWAQEADFILAADGGADRAMAAGVRPHAIIGDLDSVSDAAKQQVSAENLIFVDNQNNTDLEKALDFLSAHGFTSCVLVGFLGGRWDFSLGNMLSIYPYAKKMQLTFAGENWKIYPLSQTRRFACKKGTRVSLIPLEKCTGVSLQGLKYPLQNATLQLGGTGQTLSNETAENAFTVFLSSGLLFVYAEE